MFLILFISCRLVVFSQKQNLFFDCRQAFASFNHGFFLGLRKMLTLRISNTKWCHSAGESCNFFWTLMFLICFFCLWEMLLPCCHWFLQLRFCLADVIAMLLCYVVGGDVVTIRLML